MAGSVTTKDSCCTAGIVAHGSGVGEESGCGRRAPGLQSPPRQGHAIVGQVSAAAAETFPSSSCSSMKVTRRDAAASFFPQPPSSCKYSHNVSRSERLCRTRSHAPKDAFPRAWHLLSCRVLPGTSERHPVPPAVVPARTPGIGQNSFVSVSLCVWRCEMVGVRKSSQQGRNLDSLCNTNTLPNRRHEMEERLHLYNSALKISLFCI